jgi:hypothetical protein
LVLISAPRGVVHAWNLLGALDLLVAVGTATLVHETSILTFPLSLIPAVAVPFFFANHIVIFRRLER